MSLYQATKDAKAEHNQRWREWTDAREQYDLYPSAEHAQALDEARHEYVVAGRKLAAIRRMRGVA